VLRPGRAYNVISNNGTEKVVEETTFKLSPQMAVKISDIAYSLGVVNQLMRHIMEQHQALCQMQQNQMDALLVMLYETEGKKCPNRYEYKMDLETLTLTVRATDPAVPGHP